MRIVMLGTGHAVVTECYNTCWVLQADDGRCLLVDGGGGSGIVTQMSRAGISWGSVREIFVTHKHIDHLLGVVWALRMLAMGMARGRIEGTVCVYGNDEVVRLLSQMAHDLLHERDLPLLGTRILFQAVAAGETRPLLGRPTTFFDLHAHDVSQLGFSMEYAPGRRLACCGDVALKEQDFGQVRDVDWLMHEAFCLSDSPAAAHAGKAGHSTVAQAAATAEAVGAHTLLLYHTEDRDLAHRRARYAAEAARHFSGRLCVPDDLEVLELD